MYAKCPKCGTDKTHSSRVRPGERTATTLFMKPMRCRLCKERFWVQNPSSYVAAAAIVGGVALFLGLVWLVVMHASRPQDFVVPAPTASGVPSTYPRQAAAQDDTDLKVAAAVAPDTTAPSHAAGAAEGTAAPAQTDVGLKLPDDRAITVQWYRENAEKGDLDAQYKLGLLHLTGKGALQDFGEAAKWLRLSADQGHPQAQYQLGLVYRVGHGVPIDQGQAYKWLNLAAAAGVNQAVLVRNEVMRSLSSEQLAQAQKASREWQASRPKSPKTDADATPKALGEAAADGREAKAALSSDGAPASAAPASGKN
jgi:hypothetical protein